jgi:hypothetical protein
MRRVRKIDRHPSERKNYYLIDANFLANKYIPEDRVTSSKEKNRISACMKWWNEIEAQLRAGEARVYVPDICIAEAFKALAKAHFHRKWFRSSQDYVYWRTRLRKDITINAKTLRSQKRAILFHDLPTCRDIIIAVDRFYEMFAKKNLNVSIPDLIVLACGKYLMDFFDIPRDRLHIITLDRPLRKLTKEISELSNAYDPTTREDSVDRIFR